MIRYLETAKKLTVILVLAAFAAPAFALGGSLNGVKTSLTEDQRVLHVLNRLGFGARPGDVERVKAMGIKKYIEQQLDPSSIDDSAAEAKVDRLAVPKLSTEELFAQYPNPGALLRSLDGGKKAQQSAQNPVADGTAAAMPGEKAEDAAAADRKERQEIGILERRFIDIKQRHQSKSHVLKGKLLCQLDIAI